MTQKIFSVIKHNYYIVHRGTKADVKQREKILSLEDREAHVFRRKNIFKLCLHRQHIRALI